MKILNLYSTLDLIYACTSHARGGLVPFSNFENCLGALKKLQNCLGALKKSQNCLGALYIHRQFYMCPKKTALPSQGLNERAVPRVTYTNTTTFQAGIVTLGTAHSNHVGSQGQIILLKNSRKT